MFNLFGSKKLPSDLSKLNTEQIQRLLKSEGPEEAFTIVRKAAAAGSTDAAVFVAEALEQIIAKTGKPTPAALLDSYVMFAEMAANRGSHQTCFSLAQYYLRTCDLVEGKQVTLESYENLKKSEFWHRKAAAEDYGPSIECIKNLGSVFESVHRMFATDAADTSDAKSAPVSEPSVEQSAWAARVRITTLTMLRMLPDKDIAYQFMLEELDGASHGNDASQAYARRSGISPAEYKGALNRSRPEVDGAGGPQQTLLTISFQFAPDMELVAKFRCEVGRAVQKYFKFGIFNPSHALFRAD